MKRVFFLLTLLSIVFGTPQGYKQLTHGFRLGKLDLRVPAREEWEVPSLSLLEKAKIEELLAQPFTYMARGMQSYVFQSRDGSIVIKFFRRRGDNLHKIEKTFRACQLAYNLAREETGILYLHLNPTSSQEPTLLVKDRLGRSYSLPLDRYSFVIQKRAQPFKSALFEALQKNQSASLIDSCLKLVQSRTEKGICNTDLSLTKNFGFLDGQAVEIDFGNYTFAPEEKKRELSHFVGRMRSFLKKYSPESLPEYEAQVAKLQ